MLQDDLATAISTHMSKGTHAMPRFLVIQNGARHNYAIPAAFNRVGALAGLHTDFVASKGLGRLLSKIGGKHSRATMALTRRTPPEEIAWAVQTTEAAFIAGEAMKVLLPGTKGREHAIRVGKLLAERGVRRRGTGGATHIYTMLGEGGQFVRRAKENGLGVVGDVYIALSADAIVCREAMKFPDWSDEFPKSIVSMDERQQNNVLLECSDLFICPSEFVRDDLVAHHGVDEARTSVIPYAVSPSWLSVDASPEQGRVLFAGSANLRKGIHYLAAAATLMRGSCSIYVAGGVSEKVRKHPTAKDLNFLGHLSKADMAAEFARADVFAFPSLAEGSAGVTAEALGAGLPVVTTKAAGSIVRDGIDGIIVPERDSHALAEAIFSIIDDPKRRARMSVEARERSLSFTWDNFAENVLNELIFRKMNYSR